MRNAIVQATYRDLVSRRLWFRKYFCTRQGLGVRALELSSTYSQGMFNELRFYCRVSQSSVRSIPYPSAPSPAPFQTRLALLNIEQKMHVSSTKSLLGREP